MSFNAFATGFCLAEAMTFAVQSPWWAIANFALSLINGFLWWARWRYGPSVA